MSTAERLAEVAAIQAKLDALDRHDCPYARGESDECPDPIAHASVSMSAATARALLEAATLKDGIERTIAEIDGAARVFGGGPFVGAVLGKLRALVEEK